MLGIRDMRTEYGYRVVDIFAENVNVVGDSYLNEVFEDLKISVRTSAL
jgi:hypothetical protein